MRPFLARSARASLASVQTALPLPRPLARAFASKAHVHDHNCGHDHAHDHDHNHDHAHKQSPFTLGANSIPGRASRTKKAKELIPRPTGAIEYCENLVR